MSVTAAFFLLAYLALLGLALVRHPVYGLYAYLLAFYMGPDTAWWGEALVNLRWSFLAAIITLISITVHPVPQRRTPWHSHASVRVLIAFTIWLWLQMAWALSIDDHIFLCVLFTKYIIMFALMYRVLDTLDRVYAFAVAHIVGCLYWGYLAWIHPAVGRLETIGTGDVAGSAFASMHMSTALALAGFFFLSLSGWKKWVSFFSIPLILLAIVQMQTRGAFLGLVAAAPVALLLVPPGKRKWVSLSIAFGVVLLFQVATEDFWERMSTIRPADDRKMEESAASRLVIAKANLRMFLDYPMGAGHRGNDRLSPAYMPASVLTATAGGNIRSAHNTLMAVLVDHGIVGIVLIVIFHYRIWLSIRRVRSARNGEPRMWPLAAGLATGLVIYWVNAQFANMTKAEVVVWTAAIACALEAILAPNPSPSGMPTLGQRRGRKRLVFKSQVL